MKDKLFQESMDYHKQGRPGKLATVATKSLANQHDLSLAYSPGVAGPCRAIEEDPVQVYDLTNRGNLVGVISNGTAVLGLGDIGPLAAKPVMEGKAVLFKKFADIDVFDIEIAEKDPDKLVEIVAGLEPTFGGINLEDIKAPECFYIEEKLRKRMKIPVFHDDQHGTAIIVAAAVHNALFLAKKELNKVKIVASGAGAAAIACLDLLVSMGADRKNIYVTDRSGVVYIGREEEMEPRKALFAQETDARTLEDLMEGADIFLGLSAGGVLKPHMLEKMARTPIILALANPNPEIKPEDARAVRKDAIIATGRSDYPNQVNNVLCFPFIFRGALDVGATEINEEMKMACVKAIAELARVEASDIVANVYGNEKLSFGVDYIIPKPFDPRLISVLPPAVARAAMESGVATRPIEDFESYVQKLSSISFRTGMLMRPIFAQAKADPKRIVYADGEEERVLRAVQTVVDEGIAKPVLVGRRRVIEMRIKEFALRLKENKDFELCDPQQDPRYKAYWTLYHDLLQRKGVSPDLAKIVVRTNSTVIAALMLQRGEVDGMIAGPVGKYTENLRHIKAILGKSSDTCSISSVSCVVLDKGVYFISDAYVNPDPTAEEIADITIQSARQVEAFGIKPKIALVSHSRFGSSHLPSAKKMQKALEIIWERAPELEVDGEMLADAAVNPHLRQVTFPNSRLTGEANLLIMPSIDAANIAYNLTRELADGQPVGPMLLGIRKPAHIMTSSSTVRGLLNMTAVAVVQAQLHVSQGTSKEVSKA